MELKTKYQYSYFIHPYVVEQNDYSNYILGLMKNRHIKIKVFEKQKDLGIYTYFLPKVRDFMFWTFNVDKEKQRAWDKFNMKMRAKILAEQTCTMFEYDLGHDVQGKIGEQNGIFFDLSKIEIICFNTGICFLVLKTTLEEENKFSDLLNFNYKFRDINSEFVSLKDFENIKLQTSSLKNMKDLSRIVKTITGNNKGARELNLSEERFLTYSYVCLEEEHWNESNEFYKIDDEFIKYMNVMPNNSTINFDRISAMKNTLTLGKYAKLGATNQGMVLFTSSAQMENYTKTLYSFEREYFYTYILELYKKIFLRKMAKGFSNRWKIVDIRNEFLNFTLDLWVQQITNEQAGLQIQKILNYTLELNILYDQIKMKYDIYYKDLNIRKAKNISYCLVLILIATLIFNIINLIVLLNIKI